MRVGDLGVKPKEEMELDTSGEDGGRGCKATSSSTIPREKATTKGPKGQKSKAGEALPLYGETGSGGDLSVFSVSTPSTVGRNRRKGVAGMSKLDLQKKDEFSDAGSSLDDKGVENEDGSSGSEEVAPLVPKAQAPRNTKMNIDGLSLESGSDS